MDLNIITQTNLIVATRLKARLMPPSHQWLMRKTVTLLKTTVRNRQLKANHKTLKLCSANGGKSMVNARMSAVLLLTAKKNWTSIKSNLFHKYQQTPEPLALRIAASSSSVVSIIKWRRMWLMMTTATTITKTTGSKINNRSMRQISAKNILNSRRKCAVTLNSTANAIIQTVHLLTSVQS